MPKQQHLSYPETDTKEGKQFAILLDGLGYSLEKKYSEYKGQRDLKEREWAKAVRQYEGEWDQDDLSKIEKALSMQGNGYDPVAINITRPKTNIAIARMQDLQFPTGGDFNFFVRPAPLTEEIKAALQNPNPAPAQQLQAAQQGQDPNQVPGQDQVAQQHIQTTLNNAPRMERKLRNRMIYAKYGRKARLAIEDLCIKGTAILKGPTVQNRKHRRYTPQEFEGGSLQMMNEMWVPEPSVERVAPEMFFPDPSARLPEEIEDCIEGHLMSAKDMIELARNPSFMPEQIAKVLQFDPDNSEQPDILNEIRNDSGQTKKGRYFVKEYHGPLDKRVLFDGDLIDEEDLEDPLVRFTGEIWYCNKHVIRVSLSTIEGDDELPYSLTTWEPDPNSVFGHGHPFLLRNAQRVANSAYLMLLDNASLTAGPQIVLNREMIEPANVDDDYSIAPMKAWFLTEYGADVREAMQFVNVPAQMEGIGQILDTAMQFADVESSTPMMHQGEAPSGNNTTTGMAMIMSATNILQKRASMMWDDNITQKIVPRFYHYEMQYGDDESVKGDYEIQVGGATERIDADLRAQEIERMLGLASSNEEFMMSIDAPKAFRALVDNTRTGDILRSEEEVAALKQQQEQSAAQAQQNDPNILKAQAQMMMAQARMEEVKAKAQLDNAKQETLVMEIQAKHQTFYAEAQSRNNEALLRYQVEMAKLALERDTTVAKLEQQLEMGEMDYAKSIQLKEMDWEMQDKEIDVKHEFGEGI